MMDGVRETMTPAAAKKAVVLVDWHWVGHHPTYFAHFVLALEQLGIRVLALCPRPEEARVTVSRLREALQPLAGPAPTEYKQLPGINQRRLLPSRLGGIERTIKHFRSVERIVRQWEVEKGVSSSEIFYSCIYDWDFAYFKYAYPFLRLPWSGLYMRGACLQDCRSALTGRSVSTDVDPIFRDKKLKGVAILDEGVRASFAERVKRPVVIFPDFTDERMPGSAIEFRLSDRLRAFAGKRPVIGLFGHLQRNKGLTTFCAAARSPELADVCFAAGGEVDWLSFSPEERWLVQNALADSQNIWTHFARIPDDVRLNSVLATCSILFAAYVNFPHSSNILTKAALLKKPVIVSDGSLMAERVRRFRLGEVVPEGDTEATAAAILRMTRDLNAWTAEHKPDWEAYRRRHSFDALKAAFSEMFYPARQSLHVRNRRSDD